jgi:hypothetical protein
MKRYHSTLVMVAILLVVIFSDRTFAAGDWSWSSQTEGYYYAATVNAAGHVLGQYCYFESGSCLYLVGIGTNCEPQSQYPALVNSDVGSAMVTLVCSHKFGNQYILAINSFDDIDRLVREATTIGFAVPMKNGEFKVCRFSLIGAEKSINTMREAAERRLNRKPENRSLPAEERL